MIRSGLWQATDAVIAVPEQFDTQAGVVHGQFVEPGKQLVQHADKFLRRALWTERRETTDVSKENTTHIDS